MMLPTDHAAMQAARSLGRASAVAAQGQRDLQAYASAAPDVFPPRPFDATLFGMVCQANAVSGAGLSADELIVVNRAALLGFAVDWQIDYLLTDRAGIDALVGTCQQTAAGSTGSPADGALLWLLADVRDRVAARTSGLWQAIWRDELRRMLEAMVREWDWRAAGELPDLEGYLANSDNLGSAWVNLSHWLYIRETGNRTGDAADATSHIGATPHIEESVLAELVLAGLRDQQVVIRLLNDLGTHRRDLEWGDVNALLLGVDVETVHERVAAAVRRCQATFAPLRDHEPRLVAFLEGQIGFCAGFYGVTDYWGEL